MRRTKEWWHRLAKWQRRRLVELEYANRHPCGYGGGGYLPEDCSDCSGCGQPQLGIGLCQACSSELATLVSLGSQPRKEALKEVGTTAFETFRTEQEARDYFDGLVREHGNKP